MDAISCQLPGGFYTTFRTYEGGRCVIGLTAHLDRLYAPAAELGLQPSRTRGELRHELDRLLASYRPAEARIRISLEEAAGRIFVTIKELTLPPLQAYEQGVRVVTTRATRESPLLKRTAFISKSQSERAALSRTPAFEGLIVQRGRILEGMTSNFFYVQGNTLGTAGRGVLRGVTRAEVLRLAREELSISVRYRALRVGELAYIQEAFISSSSRGIVPVVQVDEVPIGSSHPGVLTVRLMQAYKRGVLRQAETI